MEARPLIQLLYKNDTLTVKSCDDCIVNAVRALTSLFTGGFGTLLFRRQLVALLVDGGVGVLMSTNQEEGQWLIEQPPLLANTTQIKPYSQKGKGGFRLTPYGGVLKGFFAMDTSTPDWKLGFAALMIPVGHRRGLLPALSSNMVDPAPRQYGNPKLRRDRALAWTLKKSWTAAKEAARRYNQQQKTGQTRWDRRCRRRRRGDTGTSYVDLIAVGESLGYKSLSIRKSTVQLPIYEGHQRTTSC